MDEKYRESPAPIPSNTSPITSPSPTASSPPSRTRSRRSIRESHSASPGPKNGYLPTHNPNYCLPQGPDPVWNNANCRKQAAVQRPRGEEDRGQYKTVPAADLSPRHGRRQLRADEGPVVADPRWGPPLGRIPHGIPGILNGPAAMSCLFIWRLYKSLPLTSRQIGSLT